MDAPSRAAGRFQDGRKGEPMSRKEQIDAMEEIITRAYYAATGIGAARPSARMLAIDLYEAGFEKKIIKAAVRRPDLTREKIDNVLMLDLGRHRFKDPEKIRAVCYMKLTGATFAEIGQKYNLSGNRCQEIVRRVENLYRLYIEK